MYDKHREYDLEYGGGAPENEFVVGIYIADASREVRMGFIRKVYAILTVQLIVTACFAAGFMFIDGAQDYVLNNRWTIWVSMVLSFVVLIAMMFVRRVHPWNFVLLFTFTIFESWLVGAVVSFYDVPIVIEAFLLTMTVFLGLTLFTFVSNKDFSFMGSALFCCLWILIIGGIINLIWPVGNTTGILLSIFGCIVFSLYILYDTSLIIHRHSTDEYIVAAISLYLDVLNLFLYILDLLNRTR